MHILKINMTNGDSHLVKAKETNMIKFMESLLPRNNNETISTFDTFRETTSDTCSYNAIVIVGSKVSSVEYYHN